MTINNDNISIRKNLENLTLKKRKRIKEFYYQGLSYTKIAQLVKVNRTTIVREIKYNHKKAHQKYLRKMNNSSRFKSHLAFFHHFQRNYDAIQSFEQFYLDSKLKIEDGIYLFKLPSLETVYNWYHSGRLNFSKIVEYRVNKYRYGKKTYLKDPYRNQFMSVLLH